MVHIVWHLFWFLFYFSVYVHDHQLYIEWRFQWKKDAIPNFSSRQKGQERL